MLMPLPPLVTVIAEGSAASPPGIQTPATGPSPEASAFFLSLDRLLLPQGEEQKARVTQFVNGTARHMRLREE
jgi:hypothetical protein